MNFTFGQCHGACTPPTAVALPQPVQNLPVSCNVVKERIRCIVHRQPAHAHATTRHPAAASTILYAWSARPHAPGTGRNRSTAVGAEGPWGLGRRRRRRGLGDHLQGAERDEKAERENVRA